MSLPKDSMERCDKSLVSIDNCLGRIEVRLEAHEEWCRESCPTLRDRFAMAALTGLLATEESFWRVNLEAAAGKAYEVADAMLAQQGKESK